MVREGLVKELGLFYLGKGGLRRCFKHRKGCDGDSGLSRHNRQNSLPWGQGWPGLDRGNTSVPAVRIAKKQWQHCTGGIWQGKNARTSRAGLGSTVSPLHAHSTHPLPPSPLKTHFPLTQAMKQHWGIAAWYRDVAGESKHQ